MGAGSGAHSSCLLGSWNLSGTSSTLHPEEKKNYSHFQATGCTSRRVLVLVVVWLWWFFVLFVLQSLLEDLPVTVFHNWAGRSCCRLQVARGELNQQQEEGIDSCSEAASSCFWKQLHNPNSLLSSILALEIPGSVKKKKTNLAWVLWNEGPYSKDFGRMYSI